MPRVTLRRSAVRTLVIVLAVLTCGVAGVGAIRWALGTCEPLDRLLGRSGCVAKQCLANVDPLGFRAVVPVGGTAVRLFGFEPDGERLRSVQVALDPVGGGETSREPLPLGPADYLLKASPDGARVALICTPGDLCAQQRPQGFILSATDGTVVDTLATADALAWEFAGVPVGFADAVLADRDLLASPDPRTGGVVLRRLDDGSEVARLAPDVPTNAGESPSTIAVRASPSGRFVAVVDNSRIYPDGGTRVDVWDVDERRQVAAFATDADHRIDTNAAWTGDERHLIGLRTTRSTGDDRQRQVETDVYAFKVR